MKLRMSLVVCTALLYVARPLAAQPGRLTYNADPGNHGHHNPRGGGSDHGGHDENGDRKGHKHDDDDGGHRELVLISSAARLATEAAAASLTEALRSGTLTQVSGATIPLQAQSRTYALLLKSWRPTTSGREIASALANAGTEANALTPSLVRALAGLGANTERLPSAVAEFNRFTSAASPAFLSAPPGEYVAIHTVLTSLVAAAASAK